MIFKGLKKTCNQLFLNKNIAEFLKKSEVSDANKTGRILIFSDDITSGHYLPREVSEMLNISEDHIDLIIFKKKRPKDRQHEFVITSADFGWFGQVKSEELRIILTNKYDLLINYCKVDNLYGNLLLLQSKTALKIGFAHFDTRFYKLIIKCDPSDRALFNSELIKYLKILNKIP
jgi:hypothetical protein